MPDCDAPPFPVRVVRRRGRGRALVATSALPAGCVALRVLPLALVPADDSASARCAACLCRVDVAAAASPPSSSPGAACRHGCGALLCADCAAHDARYAAAHAAGECVSLRTLAALRMEAAAAAPRSPPPPGAAAPPPAPAGDSGCVRLLLRLAYVRALARAGALPPARASLPSGCGGGDDRSALADDWEDAAQLMDHWDDLGDGGRAHAAALASTAASCLVGAARTPRAELARLAAALFCNTFDVVCPETGCSLGEGLFPSAALSLNHSCDPNLDWALDQPPGGGGGGALSFVALRAVAKGEELTVSYCSLFPCATTRRRGLRATFHFRCACRRCCGCGGPAGATRAPPLLAALRLAQQQQQRRQGGDGCAAVAAAADAAAAALAPLVAAGAGWARLALARARWAALTAGGGGSGGGGCGSPSSPDHTGGDWAAERDALAAELSLLLGGGGHEFVHRVRAWRRPGCAAKRGRVGD